MHASRILPVVLCSLTGCVTVVECDRRRDAAHVDALRDAQQCAFDPDGLLEADCANFDRTPLRTYEAVFCTTAGPSCIEGDDRARIACFGDPSDTGLGR